MAKRAIRKTKTEKIVGKKEPIHKDNNVKLLIITIVALCAIFLVSYYLFSGIGKVYYKGLVFTEEKSGNIPLYHYYYYFTDSSGQQYKYNLYLRKDPSVNKVPIEGEIVFSKTEMTYISINSSELKNCPDSSIGIAHLAGFLTDNMIKVKGATPEQYISQNQNITYADCNTFPDNVVILITSGNKTQITLKGNCHKIEISNCEVLDAIEKFEVQSILDAKNRAKSGVSI